MLIKYIYWRYFFIRFFRTFWASVFRWFGYTSAPTFSYFFHIYTLYYKDNLYVVTQLNYLHAISSGYVHYEMTASKFAADPKNSHRYLKIF